MKKFNISEKDKTDIDYKIIDTRRIADHIP